MPLLKIKNRSLVTSSIKNIEKYGFIKRYIDKASGNRLYVTLTEMCNLIHGTEVKADPIFDERKWFEIEEVVNWG